MFGYLNFFVSTGRAIGGEGPNFAVTPTTVQLCATGRARIDTSTSFASQRNTNFLPPEFYNDTTQLNELIMEKVSEFQSIVISLQKMN